MVFAEGASESDVSEISVKLQSPAEVVLVGDGAFRGEPRVGEQGSKSGFGILAGVAA